MNILYYIPAIGQEMGGIRQYAVALLKILSKDTGNKYFIYHEVNDPEIMAVLNHNTQLKLIETSKANKKEWNVFLNKVKRKASAYFTRFSKTKLENDLLDKICKKHQIDIIHCPYQYLPQSKNTKSICTMHDVQELHFPEYFSPEDRAYRAVHYLEYIKHADKIIVSYQHIKNDIIKYFQTPADKIQVCLLEMDNLWFDKYSVTDIEPLISIGINGAFIFYPANTWQHKNHYKLLEALTLLKEQGFSAIKVVCTGHKTPYFENVLKPFIEQHKLHDQIIFAGILEEKLLYSLYKKCRGVIVPTLYEAGSFPLMESILLDVPVICSNVTSLPETIGDMSFVFDPEDATDISQKLKQLWEDDEYRKKSIENCHKQAIRLKSTGAFDKIMALYSSLN